jgi:hypothetical protein
VTDAAVAVNAVLLAPAGMVTVPGTVTLELLSDTATAKPPVPAAPVRLTVHEAEPGVLIVVGEQVKLFRDTTEGGGTTVIVPPLPEDDIDPPAALEDIIALSAIGIVPAPAPLAIVSDAMATVPALITAGFIPKTTHVVDPVLLEQVTVFAAESAADPTLTATPAIEEEYDIVH